MHRGFLTQPGGEAAGRVITAAVIQGFLNARYIVSFVAIEWRHSQVAFGRFRLLFVRSYQIIAINCDNRCPLLLFQRILHMTHHTGGFLLFCKAYEGGKAEIQHIVTGHDQQIIRKVLCLNCQLDVPDCAETSLVGTGAVIDHRDRIGTCFRFAVFPVFKMLGKFVVGYYDKFVYICCFNQIINKPVQNSFFAHFQKRLRIILSQRIKPRGISGSQYQTLHMYIPLTAQTRPRFHTGGMNTCLPEPEMLSDIRHSRLLQFLPHNPDQSVPCSSP